MSKVLKNIRFWLTAYFVWIAVDILLLPQGHSFTARLWLLGWVVIAALGLFVYWRVNRPR